jgi:hypothetical protein
MHVLDLRYHEKIMHMFFRLLLWLSITVLSLQGGAAMAVGQAEASAHESVATTGHRHHQAAEQSDTEHCSKPGAKAAASPHAKCATCASCCVGAAAPPALPSTLETPSLASVLHALPEAAMTSFVPSTIERPPRDLFV